MTIRVLRVLGGPLDGGTVPLAEGVEEFAYCNGGRLHIYVVGELFSGDTVEVVVRQAQVIPSPYGRGPGG